VNTPGKKVLFIVNKYAGTGYQPAVEGRIIDACERADAECTIEFTRAPGHAVELAGQAPQQGFDFVVAVGGDGTINEVARGALKANIPMGLIPRGSGNGLSRHLGIPLGVADAAQSLFQSTIVPMDAFTVNGKLSLNVSGIGFDGHIANLFGGTSKRGLAGYARLTMQEFFAFREFEAEIEIAGKRNTVNAFIIAIANSSQYGNNARIAPRASVTDGLLHINTMKKVPVYRLDFIYNMFAGDVGKTSFCDVQEAPSLVIRTSKPVAYHVDGEPSGHNTEFKIEVLPGAIQILAPTVGKRVDKR
jgi:YegS/Rv2252/BmrU family lipid kinase